MRNGMKWSDGQPFSADDIMFWYEDIILNDELTPSKPGALTVGGELAKVTQIDDYTVEFSFAAPNGVFLGIAGKVGDRNLTRRDITSSNSIQHTLPKKR